MAELLIVAVALFGFAMVSERFSMSPITAPMVFTAIGVGVPVLMAMVGWGTFIETLAHRLATEPDPMPENEPVTEMATRRLIDPRPPTPIAAGERREL